MQKMEMVDFDSSSMTSNIRVKRKTKRRNNKIASPSPCKVEMTSLSPHSSVSDVSHIFMANISSSDKHKIKKSQTYFTEDGASTSNDISEIASLNQQALDLSYTTKSKTAKSYRDLIKERFQVIKQQVSNKSTNNELIKTFKSRAERIAMLNRNIEAMKKENLQIDNDLNKYNSLKQNFDDTIINYCEMYNFFCEEALNDVKNEEVEEVDSDNNDNNKENNEKFVIVNLPAEKLDLNVEFAEKDMFWYPKLQMTKSMFVLCNNSLNNSRDNDDDGLYKVDLPKLPQNQMKLIKARLGADEIDWFRSDGELNILENPLNNKTYHPENYAEPKPILTQFNRAKKSEELNDDLTSVVVITENILKIHISCLKFLHHPLFSIEHVLEQRLLFLYDQYREILVSNKIEHISKRLDTLRFRKKAAEDLINAQGDGHKDNIIKEIRKHTMEVKETRDELFIESKNFRNVIKEILDIWTAIKQLREENGYSNTNIRLIIRKEEQDYDKDHKKNRKLIELVSTEILEESWESNDDSLSEEASNISQEVKNKRFKDKNYIKDEVDRKFKECFRTPGEPIIHFSITYDEENNLHNKENTNEEISAKNLELKRQNAVNTTKIYLRFLCNNLEICKCNTSLNKNFTCLFGESFSVKLTNVPELLTIEVYEQTKKLLKRKICDIKLRLPKFAEQSSNNDLKEVMFSKEEIVHYTHEGVGSSINAKELIKLTKIKNMEFFDKLLVTTGILTYNLQWECKQQNDNLNINQNIINDVNKIDLQKLKDWTKHSGIDPEDPKNAMLFQYIEEFNQGDAEEGEEDVCSNLNMQNPNLNQFLQFCDKAKIEENIRFKFLELRDKNEREFVGMVVPNRIKEIPTNVLSAYKRRLNSEDNFYFESEYEDDVDRKRSKGGKYLQLIYKKIFQQCINTKNHLEYEDVVDEKMFTYVENIVKVLFYNFLNWFKIPPQMSQSLPKIGNENDNKETFDLSSKLEALNRTIQIFICVETVINFPTRLVKKIKSETSSKLDGNEEDGDNEEKQSTAKNKAGCFVQISHKEEKMRTKSVSKENPKWDETFTITLQAKNTNYLNPEALNGHITVDVFDEVDRDEEGDFNEEDSKSKKSWLGFVNIPMLAIFQHKKMEGLFQLNSPQVLFGFEQFLEKSQINSPRFSHPQNIINKNPYIQLKIHAESNIPKMHPNVSELASNEPAYLYKHITSWSENYAARFPTRKFPTLAIDLNCKTCCITRYITPLEPPLINRDGFEVSLEQCVRFVSLIPFNEHNSICASIWQTTSSLLKTMTGTIYDHAIALTNFFVALEVEVWLLLGFGVPYGSSAFVLVREYITENEEPSHFIFDVTTGLKYNVQDKHSPLHRVYCVVNQKNVWANVQRSDDPASIRFDFSKRGDWLPLFNNQISAPTISIQQKLIYNTAENVQNIEYKLEKKIQRRIMKLRKMHRTIWNHDLTNRFRMVMKKFEMSIANGKHNFEMLEMKKVLKTNRLNGFVISVPYTNAKAICKLIADTSIHQVEEDSEFILAVHLHSYPNHVIAIWIVFATINK